MTPQEKLSAQLDASFKNRAVLYYLIFDELRGEVGEEKATEILKRAIYRRGRQIGGKYAQYAPDDLSGLMEAFLNNMPDDGKLFDPEVVRCDDGGLDINLRSCPLKRAWQEIGLSDEDLVTMCRIAGEIDLGTFEGAGFGFEVDTWQPGRAECCHLHIRPG